MNKVFGYIFTGIGFLVIIATILMIVIDEPYFGTMPEFNYLDYYLFPIIFTIFPIGIGRFLIYRENNWKNLVGVILIFIGILLLWICISVIVDSMVGKSSDLSYDTASQILFFGIIPIVGGLFLIFRKKEQINSDSQNITDEDQNGITNSQNNYDSIDSKLEKLKSMLNKELITKEEFNTKKQKLIDEM